MAVTTQNSTEYGYQISSPPTKMEANVAYGKMRVYTFNFTQSGAGDATSLARLIKLPAGKVTVLTGLSRIYSAALGAARTMDIGHLAYQDQDGTAVAADPDDLHADEDVSSATDFAPDSATGAGYKTFESRGGVVLTAQVNDAALDDTKTIKGFFVCIVE